MDVLIEKPHLSFTRGAEESIVAFKAETAMGCLSTQKRRAKCHTSAQQYLGVNRYFGPIGSSARFWLNRFIASDHIGDAQEPSMSSKKTVIVTGASKGIGAAIVRIFLDRGYNVVATSRSVSNAGFALSTNLALVDGDIGETATAERVAQTAIGKFGSIDHVVNNAGIFTAKPFTEYTVDDFRSFVSTNLEGFIFITQIAVRQMLLQGTGGSVTTITAALSENPISGVPASIPMITKGGLDAITLSLANEYAKSNIRFNAVAPGVVDTPLHEKTPKDFMKTLSPMGVISDAKDIAEAVLYLTEARTVTGEVLHVDGGAHVGKW
jgi:NAD(P)-dependent dehydrogenase (short-subunit alcohol dehydrogenase family)